MTEELKQKIQQELQQLESELRTEIPQELKKAVALGDLSENAEYESARNRQDYVRARNAVAVAESGGKGNSSTQGVKSSLESAAGKLFKEAHAEMGSDEKSAREKLKQVQQMVDSKSQWHQKAGKLLSGG